MWYVLDGLDVDLQGVVGAGDGQHSIALGLNGVVLLVGVVAHGV